MIKLIALDLDGTLLNKQGFITEKTNQIIQEIRSRKIKVVICTGRPFYSLSPLLKRLNLNTDDYVISFNGALLSNTTGDEVLFEKKIEDAYLLELIKLSKELGINYHVQTKKGIYTNNQVIDPFTAYDCYLNKSEIYPIPESKFIGISVLKMMFVGSEDKIKKIIPQIPKKFKTNLNSMQSLDYFYEFLSIKANKGMTLRRLTQKLKIDSTEVLAIGDNENDLSMLNYAGISVAMGNANPKIKRMTNYITKTNEEEGVRHTLLHVLKNEK